MAVKWKIEGQIHSCSLPMSVGQYPVNLHFVLFHLVYVHPQIPAGRIRWTIYSRCIVIVICVLLDLGGVVLAVVQEQVCEASGLWGVLARACSVRVHRLEGIQAPFPAVAEGVRVHLHLRLRSREGLGTLMLPVIDLLSRLPSGELKPVH